jgi:hypothetical protein
MEAFNAILERRLQLTVPTLGQAVWTPSSIFVIIYSISDWDEIGVVGKLTKILQFDGPDGQ